MENNPELNLQNYYHFVLPANMLLVTHHQFLMLLVYQRCSNVGIK